MVEDSSDSDHSMSLLALDTQAQVPCNAVLLPESPLLYDEEDDATPAASIMVNPPKDLTPSQPEHSPLPYSQPATQRGRKATKKGKGKGRERGKAPNSSLAPNLWPGSSTTAELEEGL